MTQGHNLVHQDEKRQLMCSALQPSGWKILQNLEERNLTSESLQKNYRGADEIRTHDK